MKRTLARLDRWLASADVFDIGFALFLTVLFGAVLIQSFT